MAKEYLLSVRKLGKKIYRLGKTYEAKYQRYYPSGISYDGERVQSSGSGDQMSEISAELDSILEEIAELKVKRNDMIDELNWMIDQIDDDRVGAVLTGFYIGGDSCEKISHSVGYTPQHTRRLRVIGEYKIQQLLDKDVRYVRPECDIV